MESHDDKDAKQEALASFRRLAETLTQRGENRITAGAPGEQPIEVWDTPSVHIRQMPDDPLALRVSIGEAYTIGEQAYCVFRGDRQRIVALLQRALDGMRGLLANADT